MLGTSNLGVGLPVVWRPDRTGAVLSHLDAAGETAYVTVGVVPGTGMVAGLYGGFEAFNPSCRITKEGS